MVKAIDNSPAGYEYFFCKITKIINIISMQNERSSLSYILEKCSFFYRIYNEFQFKMFQRTGFEAEPDLNISNKYCVLSLIVLS